MSTIAGSRDTQGEIARDPVGRAGTQDDDERADRPVIVKVVNGCAHPVCSVSDSEAIPEEEKASERSSSTRIGRREGYRLIDLRGQGRSSEARQFEGRYGERVGYRESWGDASRALNLQQYCISLRYGDVFDASEVVDRLRVVEQDRVLALDDEAGYVEGPEVNRSVCISSKVPAPAEMIQASGNIRHQLTVDDDL